MNHVESIPSNLEALPEASRVPSELERRFRAASVGDRTPAARPTVQMTIGCLVIPLLLAVVLGAVLVFQLARASSTLVVPGNHVLLVRTLPDDEAPLVARFGSGETLTLVGRTADRRWLQLLLWGEQVGWAKRPLDVFAWRIDAPIVDTETAPQSTQPLPTSTNSTDVTMIEIAAATFTMGSPPGMGEADESPAHVVMLSAFAIDQTEVTLGRYWRCVEAGACAAPAGQSRAAQPQYLNNPQYDQYPATGVSWGEAKNYCNWLGKRLPTEAEWEMAAGWDGQRQAKLPWPWGNDDAGGSTTGIANVGRFSLGEPAPVGTFPTDRSPYGLLDMGGNVREWVLDWYKIDYYMLADESDPQGPTNRRGEGTGRVVRGASYADEIFQARTANRNHADPTYGYETVGFRCVQNK